jgi:hypothetical protein
MIFLIDFPQVNPNIRLDVPKKIVFRSVSCPDPTAISFIGIASASFFRNQLETLVDKNLGNIN